MPQPFRGRPGGASTWPLLTHATNLRRRPEQGSGSKAEIITELRQQLWPRIAEGAVAPVVAGAHKLLDSAQTVGKVPLTVREP